MQNAVLNTSHNYRNNQGTRYDMLTMNGSLHTRKAPISPKLRYTLITFHWILPSIHEKRSYNPQHASKCLNLLQNLLNFFPNGWLTNYIAFYLLYLTK